MTKHLAEEIILLDCSGIWLQMIDNTCVELVSRQFKETFTKVTLVFFIHANQKCYKFILMLVQLGVMVKNWDFVYFDFDIISQILGQSHNFEADF